MNLKASASGEWAGTTARVECLGTETLSSFRPPIPISGSEDQCCNRPKHQVAVQRGMETLESTAYLQSLLNCTLRIQASDTRIFVGEFKCTDSVGPATTQPIATHDNHSGR